MRKLIVHDTDINGSGYVQYNGSGFSYCHENDGNARVIIEELIKIGFINKEDVLIIEEDEIYEILEKALANSEGEN